MCSKHLSFETPVDGDTNHNLQYKHPNSNSSYLQIAAEIAAPLSQARKISMVSDGSGEIGAAKLTGEVLTIMQSVSKSTIIYLFN